MTLAEWLDHQQRIHPRSIELGLDRVGEVWRRLGAPRPAPLVVTVGGTNGKGSTVAFLEAMLAAAGKRVGCYTSPHLLRYNERVRVGGADVGDAALVDAFERIEAARTGAGATIALTYFEFGTLAALWIFAHAALDVAVLEVGLGGRLDAVNIVDADAMVVTTIDLDHQDWLGNDRDGIGREKAGILRARRPAIIGMRDPPRGLLDAAAEIGADVRRAGVEYDFAPAPHGWTWSDGATKFELPLPGLAAPCQLDNAAAAIAALQALRDRIAVDPAAIGRGVRAAHVAARLQRFELGNGAELAVDVAHNPQAAAVLARWLAGHPASGRTFAVFGALDDKDVAGIVAPLHLQVDAWLLAGLDQLTPRGLPAQRLRERIGDATGKGAIDICPDPAAALARACERTRRGDRVIAFGSFYVAAAVLENLPAGARAIQAAPAPARV